MRKAILIFLVAFTLVLTFTGCSQQETTIKVNDSVYSINSDNLNSVRDEILEIKDENNTPYFKKVEIIETNGIFYNLSTVTLITNDVIEDADVSVTMPGKITSIKNGVKEENTVIFTVTSGNEYAVMSESNNPVVIVGIIGTIAIISGIFILIAKKKG